MVELTIEVELMIEVIVGVEVVAMADIDAEAGVDLKVESTPIELGFWYDESNVGSDIEMDLVMSFGLDS